MDAAVISDNETSFELDEVDASALAAEGEGADLDYLSFFGRSGYMVKGWSHLVAGYPRCGKTELIVENCQSWLLAGERILYLSEEARPIWRMRLSQLPGPWNGLRLVFSLGTPVCHLLHRMKCGNETIVIVDAIRNLGILPEDENDNSAVARALCPWVATARRGAKTLVMTHHSKKGGGEHGEGISGGHALLGAVDVALEVRRDSQANRRLVRGYARLFQPPDLLYEQTAESRLTALGSPCDVGFVEVRKRVASVLTGEWVKTKEILAQLEAPKPSLEIVRRALLAEAHAGRVERDPPLAEKVNGKTVRWRATTRT
jgi:DNA repair protein RadA/Sms